MKVIVTETEIKNAVLNQLKSQGITVDGRDVSISFSMGRKNKEGLAATVELIDPNLPQIADGAADEEEEDQATAAPAPATSTVGAVLAKPVAPKTFVSRAPVAPAAPEANAEKPVAAPAAASAAPAVSEKVEAPAAAVTGSPVAAEASADAPFDVADQQPNDPAPTAEPAGEPAPPAEKPKSLFAKS